MPFIQYKTFKTIITYEKNLVKLSAIIALMLLTTATYAQEFHIGAKAGANLGKIAGVA